MMNKYHNDLKYWQNNKRCRTLGPAVIYNTGEVWYDKNNIKYIYGHYNINYDTTHINYITRYGISFVDIEYDMCNIV